MGDRSGGQAGLASGAVERPDSDIERIVRAIDEIAKEADSFFQINIAAFTSPLVLPSPVDVVKSLFEVFASGQILKRISALIR